MATRRPIRTASKPGGATRVSAKSATKPAAKKKTPARKKAPVLKTGVQEKPAAKKAARPRKPTVKQAYRKKSKNRRAGVLKRKVTMGTTRVDVGPEPVAVDPQDEVAVAGINKRQWAGRLSAVDRANHPPQATGIALVERVTRAVERELSQIEVIVGGHHVRPQQRTEAERRARTLASLARTLTELRKLRAEENRLKPQHDDGPADIDEFRRELSRKLARLVRESQELYPDEPDGAGAS
jgi:hypothetical protein